MVGTRPRAPLWGLRTHVQLQVLAANGSHLYLLWLALG